MGLHIFVSLIIAIACHFHSSCYFWCEAAANDRGSAVSDHKLPTGQKMLGDDCAYQALVLTFAAVLQLSVAAHFAADNVFLTEVQL